MSRPLSEREQLVLDALLAVDFDGVEDFRTQARDVQVIGGCSCGCPSIDFYSKPGKGLWVRVNAGVRDSYDGLFLFSVNGRLAGIEYVSNSVEMAGELPHPAELDIQPA